jgi:single-stranded-DNA-specific exonuclease
MSLTKNDIKNLLMKRFDDTEYNSLSKLPKPTQLKDMQKATDRIVSAIDRKEKILLVGDYDVDGVVSTCVVLDFFEYLNYPIEYIIPNRFKDGYGLSVELIKDKDCDLIITVDNGISAIEAGEYCKNRGIDLIITDHHTPSNTIPHSYAIVNQKQSNCSFPIYEICGAQIAWYLVASLNATLNAKYNIKSTLDIVSIAIVADVMPLNKINRTMVRAGLKELKTSQRVSINVLKDVLNKEKFNSEDIAFAISPRLNSAGRMTDANLAIDFLRSKSYEDAYELFDKLNSLNEQRKEIEANISKKASECADEGDTITVVWGEDWHEGVIGIVASRLVEEYKRPAIVFSIEGDRAKASARSIADINIYALIKECSDMLIGFGGHKGAAGLAIETKKLPQFKAKINEVASNLDKSLFIEDDKVLGEIKIDDIDLELLDILEAFEPFGEANEKPKFRLTNRYVQSAKKVGKEQNHLKFDILDKQTNAYLSAIKFKTDFCINAGELVSFSFTISKNEFNGAVTPSLMVDEFY